MHGKVEQLSFSSPDNLRFGRGAVSEAGEFVGDGKTALIVTDPGIVEAGLIDYIEASLDDHNVSYEIFEGVEPDPKVSHVRACVRHANSIDAETLVGVGGGSSLDVTKTASVLLTNDAPLSELLGRHNVPKDGLPTVLLPTTAGTGSEVSPAAVLFDDRPEGSGEKEAIIDDSMFAETALVDPDLTMDLPPTITKVTGMDAFAHAMGSYMATTTNTFADALCVEAMSLIESNLREATFHGAEAPKAREQMSLAATMAMLGRVNGGKAAIHSIAYGIQAKYEVPHATAISMILPEVVEYNAPAATEPLAQLGTLLYDAMGSRRERAQVLVDGIYRLRNDLGLDQRLTEVGATEEDMQELVELATHSERHLEPNPRPIGHADAEAILREVW
jgi:alcohol dehydrogenase